MSHCVAASVEIVGRSPRFQHNSLEPIKLTEKPQNYIAQFWEFSLEEASHLWKLIMEVNRIETRIKDQNAMQVTLMVEGDGEGAHDAVEHFHKVVVVKHVDIDAVTGALSEMADVLIGLDKEWAFSAIIDTLKKTAPLQKAKPKRKSRPRINIRESDLKRHVPMVSPANAELKK